MNQCERMIQQTPSFGRVATGQSLKSRKFHIGHLAFPGCHTQEPCAMACEEEATTCFVLVCGLPGSGKSTFCQELMRRGQEQSLEGNAQWLHFCYDDVERSLRSDQDTFNPQVWQEARARITKDVGSLLESEEGRRVILLDDNMYYRSMRSLPQFQKFPIAEVVKFELLCLCRDHERRLRLLMHANA